MIRRFNRYELKYVLPWAKCEAIMQELQAHLPADKHGGQAGYRIVSLYYDSPDYDFFWAKVEGLKFRRKVRLRAYVDRNVEDISECLVEIKQRVNRTVQKRRLALPLAEAERLCSGKSIAPCPDPLDQRVADEVMYIARAKHLRPSAITTYHRQAFEGLHTNAGLRVTFDTDVRARISVLQLNANAENKLIVPPGWAIMEVKANEGVPAWMIGLLARYDCQLRRVSKYCLGLAELKPLCERSIMLQAGLGPVVVES